MKIILSSKNWFFFKAGNVCGALLRLVKLSLPVLALTLSPALKTSLVPEATAMAASVGSLNGLDILVNPIIENVIWKLEFFSNSYICFKLL
jgi:hypothetical protein